MGSNLSSACEGCFEPSKNYKSSIDLARKVKKTRETSQEDLDKADERRLTQDIASADDHVKVKKSGEHHKGRKISLQDFDLIRILGQGAFGKVYLVQKKSNKKYYALKALKKKDLILENLLKSALTERNILKDIKHPFVVQLKYAFQSTSRIYMVMDFCTGGDLYSLIKKHSRFDEKIVKFYAAEIIIGIQYLHEELNIIHRDIKPENILLASDGHVKITDFGLAKTNTKALTLCGTPDYLAPEIVIGRPYRQVVDWWSLGCLIYEMLTGRAPFSQSNLPLIDSIVKIDPLIPPGLSKPVKDLLTRLLKKNPAERLGNKGAQEIKNHPFFSDIDWNAMANKEITPPFRVAFTKQETPMHKKSDSNMSLLATPNIEPKPKHGHNDHNHPDFALFSYVGGDPDHDHVENSADIQTK